MLALTLTNGTKIDQYQLLDEIGQGGMATVYKGLDTNLGREIAIKIMHPHLAKDPSHRERFRREAQAVARLHHPNIIEIYDFSSHKNNDSSSPAYIIMEFIEGENLQEFLNKKELPLCELGASFIVSLLPALEHAHSQNILHRDLKPENVLIEENGDFKLTDFGLARILDDDSMTKTGTILGSPAYMAPEQAEGKVGDNRSDIFALGVLLYRLVCQTHPFLNNNPASTLRAVLNGNYNPPDSIRPGVGKELTKIITHSLTTSPEERYPSAKAMYQDLMSYLHHSGIDNPKDLLHHYITKPEATLQQTRQDIVSSLKQRTHELISKKQFAAALDLCNRILAITPDDEEIQQILHNISNRTSHTKQILFLLAILLSSILGIADWLGYVNIFNMLSTQHQTKKISKKTHNHTSKIPKKRTPIKKNIPKTVLKNVKIPIKNTFTHLSIRKTLVASEKQWKTVQAHNFKIKYFHYFDKNKKRHWVGFRPTTYKKKSTIKFNHFQKQLIRRPIWFRLRRQGLYKLKIIVPTLKLAISGKMNVAFRHVQQTKIIKPKPKEHTTAPYSKRKVRFRIYPWSKLYLFLNGEFQAVTRKHLEHIFAFESGPKLGKITLIEARTKNRNPLKLQIRIPEKGSLHYRKVSTTKNGKIIKKGSWIALAHHNGIYTLTTKFNTNFKNAKIQIRTNVARALLFISRKNYNEALGHVSTHKTILPVLWIWKTHKVPVIIRIIKKGYESWRERKILRAGETLDLKWIKLKKRKTK